MAKLKFVCTYQIVLLILSVVERSSNSNLIGNAEDATVAMPQVSDQSEKSFQPTTNVEEFEQHREIGKETIFCNIAEQSAKSFLVLIRVLSSD